MKFRFFRIQKSKYTVAHAFHDGTLGGQLQGSKSFLCATVSPERRTSAATTCLNPEKGISQIPTFSTGILIPRHHHRRHRLHRKQKWEWEFQNCNFLSFFMLHKYVTFLPSLPLPDYHQNPPFPQPKSYYKRNEKK